MSISYDIVENFPGWVKGEDHFKSLIAAYRCRRVLEVGAGANPTLSSKFVRDAGLTYVISDLSEEELQKTNAAFERIVLDLSAPNIDPSLSETFDCVLSRMVAEHVGDGHQYHTNVYKVLRPGGISAQCFSTLWGLPFAANRLLPESIGSVLQNIFSPRDEHFHGKFKAYYSWSRGPTKRMLKGFEEIGFEVIGYTGYFGHNYYLKLPWLDKLERWKSKLLLRHPVPQLCSYATFVLRKPSIRMISES